MAYDISFPLNGDEHCLFGCRDDPVGLFWLPQGCFCYPDDVLQTLCEYHWLKSTCLDGIYMIVYWGA
jgi:hypothetical protein